MSFSFRNHLLVEAQRKDQPATVIVQYQNEKKYFVRIQRQNLDQISPVDLRERNDWDFAVLQHGKMAVERELQFCDRRLCEKKL